MRRLAWFQVDRDWRAGVEPVLVHLRQAPSAWTARHVSKTLQVLKETGVAAVELAGTMGLVVLELPRHSIEGPAPNTELELWVCAQVSKPAGSLPADRDEVDGGAIAHRPDARPSRLAALPSRRCENAEATGRKREKQRRLQLAEELPDARCSSEEAAIVPRGERRMARAAVRRSHVLARLCLQLTHHRFAFA